MQLKLISLRDLLLQVTENCYHYTAQDLTDKYIVWAETGSGEDLSGDNRLQAQVLQGTIDYFTKEEFDENVDKIQAVLATNAVSFYLNSVQYEDETEYIHFEWIWEM